MLAHEPAHRASRPYAVLVSHALGSFHPTWHDAGLVLGGVACIALAGQAVRALRLRWMPPAG